MDIAVEAILSFVDIDTLRSCRLVSKSFRQAVDAVAERWLRYMMVAAKSSNGTSCHGWSHLADFVKLLNTAPIRHILDTGSLEPSHSNLNLDDNSTSVIIRQIQFCIANGLVLAKPALLRERLDLEGYMASYRTAILGRLDAIYDTSDLPHCRDIIKIFGILNGDDCADCINLLIYKQPLFLDNSWPDLDAGGGSSSHIESISTFLKKCKAGYNETRRVFEFLFQEQCSVYKAFASLRQHLICDLLQVHIPKKIAAIPSRPSFILTHLRFLHICWQEINEILDISHTSVLLHSLLESYLENELQSLDFLFDQIISRPRGNEGLIERELTREDKAVACKMLSQNIKEIWKSTSSLEYASKAMPMSVVDMRHGRCWDAVNRSVEMILCNAEAVCRVVAIQPYRSRPSSVSSVFSSLLNALETGPARQLFAPARGESFTWATVHAADLLLDFVETYCRAVVNDYVDLSNTFGIAARAKKAFEVNVDGCVAKFLYAVIEDTIVKCREILIDNGRTNFNACSPEADIKCSEECIAVINLLTQLSEMCLVQIQDRELINLFRSEMAKQLFDLIVQQIRRKKINSSTGAFKMIADLNAFYQFACSIKLDQSSMDYFEACKEVGNIFLLTHIPDLRDLIQNERHRFRQVFSTLDLLEICKSRSDWSKIKHQLT